MSKEKHVRETILTRGRTIALIAAIVLIVSAFLPWGQTEHFSRNGLVGDGIITVSIGVLAFLLLFIKRIPVWVSLVLGVVGSVIGITAFVALSQNLSEIKEVLNVSGQVSVGIYLTILTSLAIVLGCIVEIREEKTRKLDLFYVDEEPHVK